MTHTYTQWHGFLQITIIKDTHPYKERRATMSNTAMVIIMAILVLVALSLIPATFIANKKRNKTAWLDGYEHASHIHGTPTDRNQIASDHPITTSGWQLKRGEMFTDGYLSALTDLSLPYNQIDQQECVHNHYYAKDNALTIASSVNNAATRLHH